MGYRIFPPCPPCPQWWRAWLAVGAVLLPAALLYAHDLERTQVLLTLSRDGSFIVEVANDPAWLKLRTESIPGPFADRVVLFVDGREIRPASEELIANGALATHRLRGTFPAGARTLRWYYGLVIDPYPLTIRRSSGRIETQTIAGDAWSPEIDLRGEFRESSNWVAIAIGVLFGALLLTRVVSRRRLSAREDTQVKYD
jgi:hypothetical protein